MCASTNVCAYKGCHETTDLVHVKYCFTEGMFCLNHAVTLHEDWDKTHPMPYKEYPSRFEYYKAMHDAEERRLATRYRPDRSHTRRHNEGIKVSETHDVVDSLLSDDKPKERDTNNEDDVATKMQSIIRVMRDECTNLYSMATSLVARGGSSESSYYLHGEITYVHDHERLIRVLHNVEIKDAIDAIRSLIDDDATLVSIEIEDIMNEHGVSLLDPN